MTLRPVILLETEQYKQVIALSLIRMKRLIKQLESEIHREIVTDPGE